MSAGARVAAFVALLVVTFAGAALAGGAIDPGGGSDSAAPHGAAGPQDGEHSAEQADGRHDAPAAGATPAGVSSAQGGYRIVATRTRFAAGRAAGLRFRILGADDAIVRTFEAEQGRRMHLIVVRRDLRRYQHLHPVQGADGDWTTRMRLPDAGVYRAFADFRTGGERHTLGVDLFVAGSFEPLDLPAASRSAGVDGYVVARLEPHPGVLSFEVRRDGRVISDLQPYLGARGHLVALRDGDLAYQHVHPVDGPGPQVSFDTGDSQPGRYRLFLQFRHRDRVHTAAFTRDVAP